MMPIVFIHQQDSFYLRSTLYQARLLNPNSEIFLIGTPDLKRYQNWVTWVDITEYSKSAKEFEKVYKHLSVNKVSFELFCFQRWFILRDCLRENNLRSCIHLDSDVLLYSSAEKLAKEFGDTELSITHLSGHTSFQTLKGLDRFCDYVMDQYQGKSENEIRANQLTAFASISESNENSISDLTLLWNYSQQFPERVTDTYAWPHTKGWVDRNITPEDGEPFVKDGSFNKISWNGIQPYYTLKATGEKVVLHSLHFQGEAKKVINNHIPVKNANFYITRKIYRVQDLVRKAAKVTRIPMAIPASLWGKQDRQPKGIQLTT